MPKSLRNQSDASKAIKRVNQRIADLNKLQSTDNPYIAPYSRAIHELGLEFTKEPGTNRYKIKNTKENQKRVKDLEKRLKQLKAKTVGEIKKEIKKELKEEAKELAKEKPKEERKAFIKEYTSKAAVQERLKEHLEDITIKEKLDFIYQAFGESGKELGQELSDLTKKKKRSDQDRGAIYNVFGRINNMYRQAQRELLIQENTERETDLNAFYRTYEEGE